MTPQTPTPGLVAYEANPTVTNTETGEVRPLAANQYATQACCDFVVNWLTNEPRTAPSGPFSVSSTDQSDGIDTYSVPLRQIVLPNGATEDAGLWYFYIQEGGADLNQPITELVTNAAQVFTT